MTFGMILILVLKIHLSFQNTNVYDYINEAMKEFLFPYKHGNICPCKKSNLSIKMRKNG